ncbi:MAG: DUF1800 domain-containing protein [Blastocatellia bacterium]|nr:DUF1800 domain-containing protein [Blastocatellia bacterium]
MERRFRFSVGIVVALLLAQLFAQPFAAQQQKIPFDESRIVTDLTRVLELQPAQTAKLSALLDARRPRIEEIQRRMAGLVPESPEFNQLRGQMERERRAVLEEFLPTLPTEQQARLWALMGPAPAAPLPPPPRVPASPIAPLKPNLPAGDWSAEEKLIPLPRENAARNRRPNEPSLSEEQRILHLLNRAGFGPRPGDVERVRKLGFDQYLEQQLHPEDLPDDFLARALNSLNTQQMATPEIVQFFAPPPPPRPTPTPTPTPMPKPAEVPDPEKPRTEEPAMMTAQPPPTPRPTPRPPQRDGAQPLRELQQAKLLRAVFSERQLQEVMVDFWYNHFNVWANKDSVRWMVTSYERDVIRPHALGRFRDLLAATAQSPAMLYYLDNFLSQAEPPARPAPPAGDGAPVPQPRRPGLNENYARELMELHTLGVNGGYTQQDVIEVARCFTGWTISQPPGGAFVFRPRIHDKGEKIVLGKRIPAGGGIEDGLRVLDLLAKHPSTARFIARKLAQRFVADEPPASLVDRAAETFRKTDGDIREVVRTILSSAEFASPASYRTKIKAPFELVASAIRATGAATDGAAPLIQAVARIGAPIYLCQPPTGYSEVSSEWMSNALLLERMNFAVALVGNKINGTRVDLSRFAEPNAVPNLLKDPRRLIDRLAALLVHSDLSAETRENLLRVLDDARARPVTAKADARTAQKNLEQTLSGIAALTLGSREFQMR